MKNFNRLALFIVFSMTVAGCVTRQGQVGQLPALAPDQPTGEVTVIRNSNFVGAANSFYIALDGKDLLAIRVGQYTKFKIAAGEHHIAVKCFGGWTPTWKEDALQFDIAAGDQEYFIVSPNMSCADIKAAGKTESEELIANSEYLEMSP